MSVVNKLQSPTLWPGGTSGHVQHERGKCRPGCTGSTSGQVPTSTLGHVQRELGKCRPGLHLQHPRSFTTKLGFRRMSVIYARVLKLGFKMLSDPRVNVPLVNVRMVRHMGVGST